MPILVDGSVETGLPSFATPVSYTLWDVNKRDEYRARESVYNSILALPTKPNNCGHHASELQIIRNPIPDDVSEYLYIIWIMGAGETLNGQPFSLH